MVFRSLSDFITLLLDQQYEYSRDGFVHSHYNYDYCVLLFLQNGKNN